MACKLNTGAVKDFFGSCYTDVTNDTSYSLSLSRRKNLMILGLFSESLNAITTDDANKESIFEDILSYDLVRDTISDFANGFKISEIDDETIASIVKIVYIHTVSAAVKIEASRC